MPHKRLKCRGYGDFYALTLTVVCPLQWVYKHHSDIRQRHLLDRFVGPLRNGFGLLSQVRFHVRLFFSLSELLFGPLLADFEIQWAEFEPRGHDLGQIFLFWPCCRILGIFSHVLLCDGNDFSQLSNFGPFIWHDTHNIPYVNLTHWRWALSSESPWARKMYEQHEASPSTVVP